MVFALNLAISLQQVHTFNMINVENKIFKTTYLPILLVLPLFIENSFTNTSQRMSKSLGHYDYVNLSFFQSLLA